MRPISFTGTPRAGCQWSWLPLRLANHSAARSRLPTCAATRIVYPIVEFAAIVWIVCCAARAIADDSPQALWTNSTPSGAASSTPSAKPSADSPQALWTNSTPSSAANADASGKPSADSPQALWTNSFPAFPTASAKASEDSPQQLWADGAPATEQLPAVAPAEKMTPSQTFWSSVDRGYQAINGPSRKEYPGFPGWGAPVPFQPAESAFYTRLDYYHWTERAQGSNLLDERGGPLYTIGYTRTGGEQRLRVEIFSGIVQYQGATFGGSGPSLLLDNRTTYFGGRIEYDLFFNLPNHPDCLLFLGLGTRVWHRSLPSVTLQPGNVFVQGYGETWVTLYPYVGLETRHDPCKTLEFYGRMRVGITAYTHNYAGDPLDTGVQPLVGATALLEEGVRYRDFSVTAWAEVFGFSASHPAWNNLYQPASTLLTIGVKAGYSF